MTESKGVGGLTCNYRSTPISHLLWRRHLTLLRRSAHVGGAAAPPRPPWPRSARGSARSSFRSRLQSGLSGQCGTAGRWTFRSVRPSEMFWTSDWTVNFPSAVHSCEDSDRSPSQAPHHGELGNLVTSLAVIVSHACERQRPKVFSRRLCVSDFVATPRVQQGDFHLGSPDRWGPAAKLGGSGPTVGKNFDI